MTQHIYKVCFCLFITQHTTFSTARTPNTRTATSPVADNCRQQVPPHPFLRYVFSKLCVIFEAPSRQSRHQVLVRLFCTLTPLAHVRAGCTYTYGISYYLTSVVHFMQSIRFCPSKCPAVAGQQKMSGVVAGRGQQRTPI